LQQSARTHDGLLIPQEIGFLLAREQGTMFLFLIWGIHPEILSDQRGLKIHGSAKNPARLNGSQFVSLEQFQDTSNFHVSPHDPAWYGMAGDFFSVA
jgi:hypothetical protein